MAIRCGRYVFKRVRKIKNDHSSGEKRTDLAPKYGRLWVKYGRLFSFYYVFCVAKSPMFAEFSFYLSKLLKSENYTIGS